MIWEEALVYKDWSMLKILKLSIFLFILMIAVLILKVVTS